jgi:hypothetical protein
MTRLNRLLLAAATAIGMTSAAQALPLLTGALPSNTYISYGGLDWTWASPVSSVDFFGSNTLYAPSIRAGWRFATQAEFDSRPAPELFLDGQTIIQSAAYWNSNFDYVDFSNGFSEVNRVFVPDNDGTSYFEIFYVRGGAVPEPAAWAMMIMGFGMVGVSMRRRTTTVTA